jgi:hypothetical protein
MHKTVFVLRRWQRNKLWVWGVGGYRNQFVLNFTSKLDFVFLTGNCMNRVKNTIRRPTHLQNCYSVKCKESPCYSMDQFLPVATNVWKFLPTATLKYHYGRIQDNWNNYLLTARSRVLPEKLKRPELLKKFPAFCGTRRFITAFTRARHLSLSWARLIQSMPPSNFSQVHFNIILPSTPGSSKWSPSLRFSH